jgi:enoyl-[acyl-carrier protein] reductase III
MGPPAMWLEGRVALVTGGSRGIGRATVLRLASHRPAHIAIGYVLDHDAARRTVMDLEALGVSASAHCADVGSEDALRALFHTMRARHGQIDLFISNAARGSFGPLLEVTPRTWQRVVDLNARAFLLGSQLAAGLMPDGGRILGISSLGGQFCLPNYGALGAAKAAIESLARYLAIELAPRRINVNVVCGGFVDTDSTRLHPSFAAMADEIAARTPVGRIATPEDLAGIIAFLCTTESDWIRGQTIVADGGFSLSLQVG